LRLRRRRAGALDDPAALHARDDAVEVADRLPVVLRRLAVRERVVELDHVGHSLSRFGVAVCKSASRSTSTSSTTLSVPNSVEYGFMPQSLCLTTAVRVRWPSPATDRSKVSGACLPPSSSSPAMVT